MPEFKSKEEYDKWKTEKQKKEQTNSVLPIKEVKQSATMKNSSPHVVKFSSKKRVFVFLGVGLLILVTAVIFSWHYMTHGKLSGNVYVTMKSGDVKKAAGIEVILLTIAQPEKLVKEIEQKKVDSDLAILAVYQATAQMMEELDSLDKMEKIYKERANNYTYARDSSNETAAKYRREYIEKSEQLKPSWAKIAAIKMEHNKKMGELLFSGKSTKVQTDVNGVYEFQGLKRGKYLLLAMHKVFDNKITWLTVAEIKERENKLDLTTNNRTVEIFYDEN